MKNISRLILLSLTGYLLMTGCGDDTTQVGPDATVDGTAQSTDATQGTDAPQVCENSCLDNFGLALRLCSNTA